MRYFLQIIALILLLPSAQAEEVSYKGTRPAAIIDVRTPNEYGAGHIDGAINIPFDQIGQRIQSIKGLKKNSPILIYCRSGRRSSMARFTLEQQGFTHILDGGGMDDLAKNLKVCAAKTC